MGTYKKKYSKPETRQEKVNREMKNRTKENKK
jgi:hypothetical protein